MTKSQEWLAILDQRFCQYTRGDILNPLPHLTVRQLVEQRKKDGMILARVENSGCEGVYVEVAIWVDERHRWEKLAFEKFLGGEIGELDAIHAARAVCAEINGVEQEMAPLIHTFPSYEEIR